MRRRARILLLLVATGCFPEAAGARGAEGASLPASLPETPFAADGSPTPACRPTVHEIPFASLDEIPTWKHFKGAIPSAEAARLLSENGFVVDPSSCYHEFFELYEQNRYRLLVDYREKEDVYYRTFLKGVPSVVTPDVMLHNLHLFFGFAISQAEEKRFLPELVAMLQGMERAALALLADARDAELEAAARDAVVFLAVGRALLESGSLVTGDEAREIADGEETARQLAARTLAQADALLGAKLDPQARRLAREEIGRVVAASARAKPTILEYPGEEKEDYTQYTVRGHYTKTPLLQGYFRGMMWLSRIQFSLRSPRAVGAAGVLTLAAGSSEGAFESWSRIDESCGFLFGTADDISFRQWLPAFTTAYGRTPRMADLADPTRREALGRELAKVEPPRIQGIVTLQEHGPQLESLRAFHLFPQRQVADALVFQALVDPKVPDRSMVTALEVPAVLGSKVASEILAPLGLDRDAAYVRQRKIVAAEVSGALEARRSAEISAAWVDALRGLWQPIPAAGSGLPSFMRSDAYGRLRLNAAMASYAELKHDTVLYAKQAAAELGGPGYEDTEVAIDDRGYVVPEVELYARVGRLLDRLRRGLEARRLFPPDLATSYERLQKLMQSLVTISVKELEGKPLDARELDLVKFIGGDLEHFWRATLVAAEDAARDDLATFLLLEDHNAQIVADVFTGDGILHVATGFVHPVYVIFEREGKLHIGRGGVSSYYEIVRGERLDDGRWRELLASDEAPDPPAWTRTFTAPAGDERCEIYFGELD